MDFQLYARVLWRFRVLVVTGVLLGLALATLSVVKLGPDGITYRQSELWSATTRVGVTQKGFPWGRLFAQDPSDEETSLEKPPQADIPVADPNRLNNLAVLYSDLAMGDQVRRVMRREGPIRGELIATPLVRGDNRIMLPLIDLTAITKSRESAIQLSLRVARAFDTYMREEQQANKVPASDRVIVQQVMRPREAEIYRPRSRTLPLVIFVAMMGATAGLAFVLENARPRRSEPEAPVAVETTQDAAHRRSA
jgi:hypothetical protein